MRRPRGRTVMKWLLVVPVVLVVSALIAGFAFQRIATASSFRRYKAPGRMVDVGGYKLHIDCAGDQSPQAPSVILESGLGGWSVDWARVQPEVAKSARVCSYDRSGMGWSERGPASASTREGIARQLKLLLENADVQRPYVLVGHSLGGIFVREFARRYPKDVAGMVFVDSSHEEMGRVSSKKERDEITAQVRMLKYARYAMPFGLQRLIKLPVANAADLPKDERVRARDIGYRSISYLAFYDEIAPLLAADAAGTLRLEPVPDVPIMALVSRDNIDRNDHWLELEKELAGLSSTGRLVVAERSGHFIQVDRPDLVIKAIKEVMR